MLLIFFIITLILRYDYEDYVYDYNYGNIMNFISLLFFSQILTSILGTIEYEFRPDNFLFTKFKRVIENVGLTVPL